MKQRQNPQTSFMLKLRDGNNHSLEHNHFLCIWLSQFLSWKGGQGKGKEPKQLLTRLILLERLKEIGHSPALGLAWLFLLPRLGTVSEGPML